MKHEKYGFRELDYIYYYDDDNKAFIVGIITKINRTHTRSINDDRNRRSYWMEPEVTVNWIATSVDYFMIGSYSELPESEKVINEILATKLNDNAVFTIDIDKITKLPFRNKLKIVYLGATITKEYYIVVPNIIFDDNTIGTSNGNFKISSELQIPHIDDRKINETTMEIQTIHDEVKCVDDDVIIDGKPYRILSVKIVDDIIYYKLPYYIFNYTNTKESLTVELEKMRDVFRNTFNEIQVKVFEFLENNNIQTTRITELEAQVLELQQKLEESNNISQSEPMIFVDEKQNESLVIKLKRVLFKK